MAEENKVKEEKIEEPKQEIKEETKKEEPKSEKPVDKKEEKLAEKKEEPKSEKPVEKKEDDKKEEKKTKTPDKIFTIPLKKAFKKSDRRASRYAISIIIQYLMTHMKTDNVKLGQKLNHTILERGSRPPRRIRVQVIKEGDVVKAELLGHEYEDFKVKPKEVDLILTGNYAKEEVIGISRSLRSSSKCSSDAKQSETHFLKCTSLNFVPLSFPSIFERPNGILEKSFESFLNMIILLCMGFAIL